MTQCRSQADPNTHANISSLTISITGYEGSSFSSCLLAAVGSEFLQAGRYAACATAFLGVLSNTKVKAMVRGHLMHGNSHGNLGQTGPGSGQNGTVKRAGQTGTDDSTERTQSSPSRVMSRSGEGGQEGQDGAGAVMDILHVLGLAARPYDLFGGSSTTHTHTGPQQQDLGLGLELELSKPIKDRVMGEEGGKGDREGKGDIKVMEGKEGWSVRLRTSLGPVRVKQLCRQERGAYVSGTYMVRWVMVRG